MSGLGWRRLAVGVIAFLVVPDLAAIDTEYPEHAWPSLMADEPTQADPAVAALQHRAKDSLDRLLRSPDAADG